MNAARIPIEWTVGVALAGAILSAAASAAPCDGFDPVLGSARFAAWQGQPGEVMAIVNRARARGSVCADSAVDLELTRIEAALRAGLYAHAADSLAALQVMDTGSRDRMALLMADLSYARGHGDELQLWLERVADPEELDSDRARFLRAEMLSARGDIDASLALARDLPAPFAAYATFNAASRAWQMGRVPQAGSALDRLIGMDAYDAAGVDLRQRGRLLRARLLLDAGQANAAAALLDYIPQSSAYARAAISLRAHAALAVGDANTAARLAAVRGGRGVDALLLPYVLEQRGDVVAAHAGYQRVLGQLDEEMAVVRTLAAGSTLGSVRQLTGLADGAGNVLPRDLVVAFLAEPEVSELMLQVDSLEARQVRLRRVVGQAGILRWLAAERNRRSRQAATRAADLKMAARTVALRAHLDALAERFDDPDYVATDDVRTLRRTLDDLDRRARLAGREDLLARVTYLRGRLLWDTAWNAAERRQQIVRAHQALVQRLQAAAARAAALAESGQVAAAGGQDLDRFTRLADSTEALGQALQTGQSRALATLAVHFSRWLDEQLQDQQRARGYAQLALARTADAMLVAQEGGQ